MKPETTIEVLMPSGPLGLHVRQDETDFYFTFYQKDPAGVWAKQGEMVLSKDLDNKSFVGIDDFSGGEVGSSFAEFVNSD